MRLRPNLHNFFYLLSSGLLIHFTGTIYRIWLARLIGAEGLGIFQMSYPVYRLLSSIAAMGLPLALTKWVAEYQAAGESGKIITLKQWAIHTVFSSSCIAATILCLGATTLSRSIFPDSRVQGAFFILALAIPFSALSSVYRGFFQGFSIMAPTAISEITEQVAEVSLTVLTLTFFSNFLSGYGYIYPVIGLTVGEVVCLATLLLYSKHHPLPQSGLQPIPRLEILHYAGPLLLNQIVLTVGMSSEAALIPRLLGQVYSSPADCTRWFGILNGMAAPIAYFPLIFLAPLSTILSPQVSAAMTNHSLKTLIPKIYLFYFSSLALSLAGGIAIFAYAPELTQLLYQNRLPVSSIRILSISLPFIALAALNLTILGAIGSSEKILTLSLWSIGLKTALFFILIPKLGINGAAWSMTITHIFTFIATQVEIHPYLTDFSVQILPKSPQPFRYPRVPH